MKVTNLRVPPTEAEVADLLEAISGGPKEMTDVLRRLIFQRDVLAEMLRRSESEGEDRNTLE